MVKATMPKTVMTAGRDRFREAHRKRKGHSAETGTGRPERGASDHFASGADYG
jgi:hypothetical protein